ncbi:hypothetical protein NMG60_11030292 [Bertholletia excelsa]
MPKSPFKRVTNYLQNQYRFSSLLVPYHNYILADSDSPAGYDFKRSILHSEIAIEEASQFLNSGGEPDSITLVRLIRACTNSGTHSFCQQLHCRVLRSGFGSNVFVSTSVINFYLKLGLLNDAHQVFVEIPQPSVASWNSLISGYVHFGQFRKALGIFVQLDRSDAFADSYSFSAALSASGKLGLLALGKSIHSKVVKAGAECSIVVSNCLIDMYGKCDSVEEAIQVFNEIIDKDQISWNSVIAASARNRELKQAMGFVNQMPSPDTISYNELISGMAQFGNLDDAIEILLDMPNPNSSSWNSIITAFVNQNRAREALEFFTKMHSNGIEMDQYTFSSILSGIASLSALTWGVLVHSCAVKYGLDMSVVVGTALIDMYFKCGEVENAELIFKHLPQKNLVTWNAMLSGFAHNGKPATVIELYEQLKMVRDLKPDEITFLNVLSACWHNQTPLEVANCYFESMVKDYGIEASPEHCASMIRLMGKWGAVSRAERMIRELGFESCGLVWRALLGACGSCGDQKVAELAAGKVIELEGDKEFVYVMMSNIYASCGKWGDVSSVRELMRKRRVRKEVGCSWIEIENTVD